MTARERITLSEAIDILVAQGMTVNDAEHVILSDLREGRMQAIADLVTTEFSGSDYVEKRTGKLLVGADWCDVEIVRSQASTVRRYDDLEVSNGVPYYTSIFTADGVTIFRSQLRCGQGSINSSGRSKSKGGRPLKHDWAKVAAYLSVYMVENDYPKNGAELVRLMTNWFDKNSDAIPDKRELERFAEDITIELKRLGK